MGRKLTITLSHDDEPESPCECDSNWKVVEFNSQEQVDEYCNERSIGLKRKLQCGTAFYLSCYRHSGSSWSLMGECVMNCQWDTTQCAGIMLFEDVENLPKGLDERKQDARNFVKTYNKWCNGNVYGFMIEDDNGEDVGSCWGFYEEDHMMQEIASHIEPGDEYEVEGDAEWLVNYHPIPKKEVA